MNCMLVKGTGIIFVESRVLDPVIILLLCEVITRLDGSTRAVFTDNHILKIKNDDPGFKDYVFNSF
jgi:hypothetical protein